MAIKQITVRMDEELLKATEKYIDYIKAKEIVGVDMNLSTIIRDALKMVVRDFM